jgi:hypothetical protein
MMATANRNDIPIGRGSAISKADLARIWRCSERKAREQVAQFRAEPDSDDYVILSTSNVGAAAGYWRSNDVHEIEAFIRETESRARNTFLSLKAARAFLERKKNAQQIHMDDLVK